MLKSALLATVLSLAFVAPAYADINENMKNSKYCESNSSDPLCMGPEMMATRTKMMEMTKEKAMETRSKYCADYSAPEKDPVCDPKMINDTTGY
jgi:hypothetical protein